MLTALVLALTAGALLFTWRWGVAWKLACEQVAVMLEQALTEQESREAVLADRIVALEWERHIARRVMFAAPDEDGEVTVDVRA